MGELLEPPQDVAGLERCPDLGGEDQAVVPPCAGGRVPLVVLSAAVRPQRLDGRAGGGDRPAGLSRLGLVEPQSLGRPRQCPADPQQAGVEVDATAGLRGLADRAGVRGIAAELDGAQPLDPSIQNAGVWSGPAVMPVNIIAPHLFTALLPGAGAPAGVPEQQFALRRAAPRSTESTGGG